MDSRLIFLRYISEPKEGRHRKGDRPTRSGRRGLQGGGLVNPPPQAKKFTPRRLRSRSHRTDVQENLLRVKASVTVLKLTQVGETSSLRRSGERWLRNSANSPRKFAIRGACASRPQKIGSSNCLSKTQDSANS